MKSVWQETVVKPEMFPLSQIQSLEQAEADTIVIGGGLAGMLTAFFLQEQGVKTIVLEARSVGHGQTGRTTAKVTAQHGLIYDKLINQSGKALALQYARANQKAIESYSEMIETHNIDCDWERLPAYLYSTEDSERLKREAEAAAQFGFQVSLDRETRLPFSVKGALCFEQQAQFHPLKFLYYLAGKLPVYEQTPVLSADGRHLEALYRGKRLNLEAKHVVYAAHYPFINIPGFYFARMHQERSYVIAMKDAADLQGMYLGVDKYGISFRNSGNLLFVGGSNHRAGENSDGGRYDVLRSKAGSWWPDSTLQAQWSAQDCMTLDGVPYIGHYSTKTPNWYVATGFGKWGMTTSMVAARLISDDILKKENPDKEVFLPHRKNIRASAGNFVKNSSKAVKNITLQVCSIPKAKLEELQPEHGGIVKYNGKKTGVYKDKNGVVYTVSTRCPHLGCQLSWNPDERSWDCPCHGSRFDFKGKLIDNPAQTSVKIHEK